MSGNKNSYESPFCTRYASEEMQYVFSADKKFTTWRRLWVALARAEMKLGLPVTEAQVKQLEEHINDIDYEAAEARERITRHDVMAHVFTYGQACPDAAGIIHLGATSCYVGDNTDVIIMRDALQIVRRKLLNVMSNLAKFADKYKDLPCLAYTHLQPAQPTTVGKRATLWLNELLMDFEDLEHRMIAEEMGFDSVVPVSGQTYSRKMDSQVLSVLSGIAQTASKFSNDMRLLQSFKEMEEPREKKQIGSSAMAYKRNPMRCERITSLARYVMIDSLNPAFTAGTQWFERTLDDSANKRISVAEAFLGVDAILNIMMNVTDGIVVYPQMIRRRLMAELPFMASENIMMDAVKKGGNRQELHDRIMDLSMEAGANVKEKGLDNNLCQLIEEDPLFMIGNKEELEEKLRPELYVGRSVQQVEEFLADCIKPILDENSDLLGESFEMKN